MMSGAPDRVSFSHTFETVVELLILTQDQIRVQIQGTPAVDRHTIAKVCGAAITLFDQHDDADVSRNVYRMSQEKRAYFSAKINFFRGFAAANFLK